MKRLVVGALVVALLAVPMVGTAAGAATPKCDGHKATIVGNDKANIIRGTAGRDVIVAKGGKDRVYGRGGNDIICAGKGTDVVVAGDGADKVFGQGGNDKLKGGAAYDILDGGLGKDACYTNANGGKKVDCEEADLEVTVTAPGAVDPDEDFTIHVLVKNVGGKPASGVEVDITYTETGVACRDVDPSRTYVPRPDPRKPGVMIPGATWTRSYYQDCGDPVAASGAVTLEAVATTDSNEVVVANNEADSVTEVVSP